MTQQIINIGTGPSTGDGDPLRTAFSEINSNFTELYGTINGQAVTFSNVSGVTTSLGSGATFDVVRYVNNYAPIINRSGSGYSVGNIITIYGNLIGGAYSTQDLTITVATLGNATLGNIATVTFSGIPAQPVTSVAGRTGNVVLTVNDIIGLSNAYAIASSTATANVAMRGYVDAKIAANIAALINGAPGALDTLQELAAALGNNASFSATIINSLATTNSNLIVSNTTTRAYIDGQIIAANSGVASAVTLANTGLKGYVDYTNSVQSTEIAAANIGLKGYVDQANTIQSAQVTAANLAITAANVGIIGYIDLANTIQSAQVTAANLAITAANVGLKGYVDFTNSVQSTEIANANVAMKGYVDLANTIQSAQVGAANLAIIAANLGMKGYVDSVATLSIYSNVNVKAYTETMGFQNFSNVNVAAYLAAQGIAGGSYSNVNAVSLITSLGLSNYSNVNIKAYTETMGFQNYGNVNVAALITTNGLTNYSNVNAKAYAESMGYQNYGNVNVAAYVTTANSAIIGYIDLANTIQSAQVNAANLAIIAANLGMKGYVDSVASQSIYGNGNVKSYLTQFNGNIVPSANVTYSLGNVTNRWKDLYLSGNTIFLGDSTISTEGGRLVTTGVAISPPTGAVGFANVQFEAPTDFAQIRSYYVDNNFGYTANLKSWSTAPIVWDELRSAKLKENSQIVSGYTPDFASLDTSGGRFANAVATLDATGNIASLTITDGGVGYDSYYPYYATDSTGYDSNYIGQPFNSGSPTGKSFRRIGLIPTTATNVGNITSVASFTRYSGLPTVGTNTYHWIGNTGSNVSITINWASNTVTSYTYIPALPALTSANDWQNWLLDYQATNNYGWIIGSGSITGGGGSTIQAVYDYLNREALPNSLTYDLSNTTWYPGNLLVNNSATIATLSSQTFFVNFNRTAIGYATVENSYGNPVYWLRGLTADSGISTAGDMIVAGDLRVAGDLYVSPDSIYLGDLQLSAGGGNLVVHGNVTTTQIVKTGVYTVTSLPTASSAGAGARAFVTDANTVVFGSALTGGAGNAVPVFSNGTTWRIG